MLDNKLIESALFLTGKTPWDMQITYQIDKNTRQIVEEFSIEKFCFYLLSPEFIEKYTLIWKQNIERYGYIMEEARTLGNISNGILQYQKGNEQLLIELLSKI